jgi:hypothetical protein
MHHSKYNLKGKKILYRKEYLDVAKNSHYTINANTDIDKISNSLSAPIIFSSNYVPKSYYKLS